MKRTTMVAAGSLVFVFAGCIVAGGGDEKVGEGEGALMCETCSSGAGAGTGSSGHTGVTSSHSSSTTTGGPPPPPQPITGLPQGLTGGIAYVNHTCLLSISALVSVGTAIGSFWKACNQSIDSGCVAGGVNVLKAIADLVGGICSNPSVELAAKVNGVQTITMTSSSQFSISAAPGWAVGSDGDRGNSSGMGFYHQELSSTGGGITDTTKSALFQLPPGTACGFHHTQNSPPQGELGTCMGYDAAYQACPYGWAPKHAFDMSSGDGSTVCDPSVTPMTNPACGYWVWCEYQDPNNFCPLGSACAQTAAAAGYAEAVTSDNYGSDSLPVTYGQDGLGCPAGLTRSAWYDDGRPSGQGLGTCAQ